MEFLDLAKKRCSIRKYKPNKVEAEKLEYILEAGRVAPTAGNKQPVRIIAVCSEEGLEKLTGAYKSFGAPLALIVCADTNLAWTRSYDGWRASEVDATIVTDHMMMAAESIGLSSVWVCNFRPEPLREIFEIPEHLVPVNVLMLGYADCEYKAPDRHDTARRPLEESVSYV